MKVLVVEDDQNSAKQLIKLLKIENYVVDYADGYNSANEFIDKSSYDIILLDWNLGDGDGLALVSELRELHIKIPVLMLSANSNIEDRVKVLDAGGDDYLCKPYSNIELLARMRALLRRESDEKNTEIIIGEVRLDTKKHNVYVANDIINLTLAEFDLLELLMKNQTQVLTRYQLSEHLNKDNYEMKHSNIIDVHIKNIRKKLNKKDFILNVRGIGYKINRSS